VRTVYVIGIGAGDPDQLTVQAIAAMNRVEVFFTVDKGPDKADLAALRAHLLARHVRGEHRVVQVADPPRDRAARDYPAAVADWQDRREALYAGLVRDELGPDGVGGFLVWGDPALYDGTLHLLGRLRAAGLDVEVVAVPGISSPQALAAAHGIALTRTGRAVVVTTGRRLAAEGLPAGVDDVVVMLDARNAFAALPDPDLDIYWGAYLGTPDEVLVSGDLQRVKAEIVAVWEQRRRAKGWIMDTYLLRRREPAR
jgi:precorrin-6A synthase